MPNILKQIVCCVRQTEKMEYLFLFFTEQMHSFVLIITISEYHVSSGRRGSPLSPSSGSLLSVNGHNYLRKQGVIRCLLVYGSDVSHRLEANQYYIAWSFLLFNPQYVGEGEEATDPRLSLGHLCESERQGTGRNLNSVHEFHFSH